MTPKRFLGMWIVLCVLVGTILGLYILSQVSGSEKPAQTVPRCEWEDGSTQDICWWHDKANGWYLNIDHGQWTYVPRTGDMIEYASRP